MRLTCAIALCLAAICLAGCGPTPINGVLNPSPLRSQKLMAMAVDEAAGIPDPDVRLTRQLNLADMQLQRGWTADARGTLAAARQTLRSDDAAKLNEHARLSGWVSISELSRQAGDRPLANDACDSAVKELKAIHEEGHRCQYVLGIANELQYLKGKPAAARLLSEAGPWLPKLDNLVERRQATVAFAAALFNFDDYDAGQQLLKTDKDAAWRSEQLQRLASIQPQRRESGSVFMGAAAEKVAPDAPSSQFDYGKNLGYRQVFQNQQKSQTSKD